MDRGVGDGGHERGGRRGWDEDGGGGRTGGGGRLDVAIESIHRRTVG